MDLKKIGNNALHNKFLLYLLLLIVALSLLFNDLISICELISVGFFTSFPTNNKIIILSIALIAMWLYKLNVPNVVDSVEGIDNVPDINSYSKLLKIQKKIMKNISTLEQ